MVEKKIYFSLVVPAFNEENHIKECLSALLDQDFEPSGFEILVVDNYSGDNTFKIAESMRVKVVSTPASHVGEVRNYGASLAKGDIIAFIDADCVAPRNWLSKADEVIRNNSEVAAIGGNYLLPDGASWVEKCWVLDKIPKEVRGGSLPGGSFIIKKEIFNSLEGFDGTINAGEDTDLSSRICSTGKTTMLHPDLRVVHLGFPKSILDFIKRQFWQSSSYLRSNYGIKDRVFILTVVFLIGFIGILVGLISNYFLWFFASIFLAPAFLMTINKYKYSDEGMIGLKVFGVLFLSFIYFIGRSAGLVFSLSGRGYKSW